MFFVCKYQPSWVNGFFTINRYVKLDPFKKVPKIEEFWDECKLLAERGFGHHCSLACNFRSIHQKTMIFGGTINDTCLQKLKNFHQFWLISNLCRMKKDLTDAVRNCLLSQGLCNAIKPIICDRFQQILHETRNDTFDC